MVATAYSETIIDDPHPKTIGLAALKIWAPKYFIGDAQIVWWPLGGGTHQIRCSTIYLLQGVFHDVRSIDPAAPLSTLPASPLSAPLAARIVALVVSAFYRARIEAAARLEAAYQWRPCPPPH